MSSTPVNDPEKHAGIKFSQTPNDGDHSPPTQHGSRMKERLRQFLHPNGKRIHVVANPAEAENLRQRLKSIHNNDDFDVYVFGSEEHLNALRHTQTHHESRRRALQEQHGEIYEQFANVQGDLDTLNVELNRITDHGVSLSAHFDRFGYSAHIKSYDEEDSPSQSGISTPRRGSSSSKSGKSGAENGHATSLKLYKMPVLRQYFHKGILWRASTSEEVQSFELFVDLLYVGIIAINGDAASEHPTGESLLRFVITFSLSWKIWNDMALIISWFETDDVVQRLSILFLLMCLFGYTTNITQAFDQTYATLIGFYLAARLYMAGYLFIVSFLVPMVRATLLVNVFMALVGIALWIASIHVEWPNQLALMWIALIIDLTGHTASIFVGVGANRIGGKAKVWYDRAFEFTPALNIEHRTERTNAFVTLVFGYTVVAILYQSAVNGIDAFFGKGVMGLIQAFCFNWIYFEVDGANLRSHAIRRHKLSALAWGFAHLPFIMSFVLGGGALARIVVSIDTPDAHLESLTETYQARSESEIEVGMKWFYCGGLSIALICMGVISLSHVHKETVGLRLRKWTRLAVRAAVAIIIMCLPLAEHLDSLSLVGTVTGLIVFLLITELVGCSSTHVKMISRDKPCRYTGECGKKDLHEYVHGGKELDLAQLGTATTRNGGLDMAPM